MTLDVLTIGEALVEVMRTEIDQPLHQAGLFTGPYPSGAPFIFAVQCARLGLKTGAIGAVGADAFGRCLLDQLELDGIDKRGIQVLDDYTTGVAFVSYNGDGSRDFVFSLGAGGQLKPDMVNPVLFEGLRCLHVMGSTLSMNKDTQIACERALELAVEQKSLISFDPNLRPELLSVEQARDVFRPFMDVADIIIPTEDELLLLTEAESVEQAVDMLLSQREGRIVIVTKGKDGCAVYSSGETFTVDGFVVEEVDPTGAGDCFDAGLIAGLLSAQSLEISAQLANACGANAVTAKGPMSGAQPIAQIERFIAEQS